MALAGGVVATAVGIVAIVGLLVVADGSEATRATSEPSEAGDAPNVTTGTTATTTTTVTTATTDTTALSASDAIGGGSPEVAEIMRFVSDARGLPFLEPVPVEFLDDAAFEDRMRTLQAEELAEGDAEERALAGQLWQALELVDDGATLFELLDRIGIEAALGYYEFDTESMVVRGAELTPLSRVTLAHELTHALDDQHFGLERPELDDADGEEAFGFLVLSEGSAESVAISYEDALSPADGDALAAQMQDFAGRMELDDVPLALLLIVQLPYLIGPELVDELIDAGGRDRLDEAFGDPPVTSEQTLEPSAFIEGEEIRPVTTPPAPLPPVDEGVFGAAGLLVLFPDATGFELAERWGGDRYVQWLEPDGRACVRIDLLGEDGADSDRYADALEGWAADHSDAVVERVGETVRLTACA